MAIAATREVDVGDLGSSGSDAPREKRDAPVVCPAARDWLITAHVIGRCAPTAVLVSSGIFSTYGPSCLDFDVFGLCFC